MSRKKGKQVESGRRVAGKHAEEEMPNVRVATDSPGHGWSACLLLLLLVAATLAAYYPAWHGGILWDDDRHITRSDLRSAEGLWRIWFDPGATQQYYPLMHSAFWVEHKLWADDTLGYHLVNIIVHALMAFLVAVILRRLAVPGAILAALIFALHPIQVESVAWISELKNTLSGVFYFGAALTYLRFDESRLKRHYALALALFVLALLSKTVTATLPAALLVVFWWRRGKLSWRRDALPLVPWFVLGGAAGLVTAWIERSMVGAQGSEYQFTLIERCLIAGRVIWFYIGKLFWPANLMFNYPRWQVSQRVLWQYLYPLALVALLGALWLLRKRSRAPLAALLFFCGSLFPVMGFFNVYPFRYSFVADHFQYIASIGIIALVAASLMNLVARFHFQPRMATVCTMLLLGGALAVPTWSQSRQYVDGITLYRGILSRNPASWMARNNLGNVLQTLGRFDDAVAQYNETLRLKPDFADAYNNLGDALQKQGRLAEAATAYQEALRLDPALAGAHYNLGNTLRDLGRLEEAVSQFNAAIMEEPGLAEAHCNLGVALDALGRGNEAVAEFKDAARLRPDYITAYINLGNTLLHLGRFEEAITQYGEVLRLKPESADARNLLGNAYQQMGRFEEAEKQLKEALRLKPDFPGAYNNLGNVFLGMGRFADAIAQYKEALRLEPDFAAAYFNMGNAFQSMGRWEDASAQYKTAIRLKPDFAAAHFNLGQLLQRLGRLQDSVDQYAEVIKSMPASADVHNNWGVALAGLGRYEEAATHFKEALRIRPDYADARANLDRVLKLLLRK
ncbi:MAG: tetratricopeptide repeat protein [Acidobacteriota bacterium]|jgi:tetratricopeptide (TPR) repeat protein